jgi:hypothetical protein
VTAANGWAASAVGAGQENTTAITAVYGHDDTTNNAAFFASSCSAGGKSDWFLGSLGEMKLIFDNLQGYGGFVWNGYWSSTESDAGNAMFYGFDGGGQGQVFKTYAGLYVRPVRRF